MNIFEPCFWNGHQYTKWITTRQGRISRGGADKGAYKEQERECKRCGKVEMSQAKIELS